jgi:excisionase family DNA binding protein
LRFYRIRYSGWVGPGVALSRADAEVIGELVARLRAERDERAAVAVERLMQQALVSPDPRSALAGYMTTGEAARLIGVSAQTIKNWVDQGRLVGSRVGGRMLVARRSVQMFFDSVGTAPEPAEDEDVHRAEADDRELMESLPAGLPDRVEALLDRQRAGHELSASERTELRRLAREGTVAATRRTRAGISRRRP